MAIPIRLGPLLLTRPVGQGGMGTVWHAQHPEGVDVAVKVLKEEYAANDKLLDVFRFEARSVSSLEHHAIVRVYDYGIVTDAAAAASDGRLKSGSPWLAMEFASGGTFSDLLPPSTWPEARQMILHLLEGLGHSHAREIIHRDLKPRNVLVRADGSPALTDFGIAHALSRASPSRAGAGTPGYMPPEQVRSQWRHMGPWTDLYSLGCLTHRLVTSRSPFAGKTRNDVLRRQMNVPLPPLTQTAMAVPEGLEAWLHKMLAPDPAARFQRAADAAWALRQLGTHHPPLPAIPSDWRSPEPPKEGRPKGMGLALFLLRQWPLVGRETEQDQLWRALNRVCNSGATGLAVLFGSAGVGKSRLARWLCERAHETGAATVLRVRHDAPPGTGRSGLAAAVHNAMRLRGLDPSEVEGHVADWLSRRGVSDPQIDARDVAALVLGDRPPPASPLATWILVLAALADERPLLLAIDDLHRADDALQVVEAIVGSALPILVVATLNPELVSADRAPVLEALIQTRGIDVIDVEPLSDEAHRRLIDAGVGLAPRLADELVRRTAGNPLFAVRTVVDWARRGMLVPTSGGFDLREGARPDLPASIREHHQARLLPLDEANPMAATALEILATLGGIRVREADWRAASEQAGIRVGPPEMETIASLGLARRIDGQGGPTRWSLDQGLLRDELIQRARDGGRLANHHRAAARGLLAHTQGRPEAEDRALRHLVEGGAHRAAHATIQTLLDGCWGHRDLERVVTLLDFEAKLMDRLELPPGEGRRVEAVIDRAMALHTLQRPGARALAREGLALALGTGDLPTMIRAAMVQLEIRSGEGALLRTDPLIRQLSAWCREVGGPMAAEGLALVEQVCQIEADDGGVTDIRPAPPQQRPGADPEGVLSRARDLARRGDLDEAETEYQRAQDAFRSAGDPIVAAELEAELAGLARRRSDLVRARERARGARQELKRLGVGTQIADLHLGLAHLARGELSQARRELAPVSADAKAPQALIAYGGLLCCAAGDWDRWDQILVSWKTLDQEVTTVDHDSAWPLEWAARRAHEAGHASRAREAYHLAEVRYHRLDDGMSLARVRKRLSLI